MLQVRSWAPEMQKRRNDARSLTSSVYTTRQINNMKDMYYYGDRKVGKCPRYSVDKAVTNTTRGCFPGKGMQTGS
jgi:hypothetical protein